MFDWGFWELVVIAVVALVVIGPERLPKVARMAGLWIGRARRTLSSVQDEIRRELKAEELKSILDKQTRSRPLETILEETIMGDRPARDSAASARAASGSVEHTTTPQSAIPESGASVDRPPPPVPSPATATREPNTGERGERDAGRTSN